MLTSTEPRIGDIPRIAFVTQRFHELKGLKTAAFGAGLLLGCLLEQFSTAAGSFHWGPIQVLVIANMAYGLSTRELDQRYRETFGDPVAPPRSRATVAVWDIFWGAVVMAAAMADMLWQANRPGPSIFAVTLASWSLFIVVRDWPRRVHHLAVVAAGAAAAIVTAAVLPSMQMAWYEVDPARAQAFLLAYTLLGVGIVAAGLFDHHLLASALRAPAPVENGIRDRLSRPGLTRAAIAALFFAGAGGSLWTLTPRAIEWAFPLVLIISGALSQIVVAARDINRWARAVNNRGPLRGRPMRLDTDRLVLMFVVALAAAIDCAVVSPRAPVTLAAAVGVWSAWVAFRDWRSRKHYLIGALASLIVVLLMARDAPAEGLAVFVFATAGAVTVESLIDYWKAVHADTV